MYNDELFEKYAKENVLLTAEVCEMLGVSRQQVSNLVKQGKIKPFKEVANASLFLKSEIDTYMDRKRIPNNKRKIIGEKNTRISMSHFASITEFYADIKEVHIYFHTQDAIFDKYYCLEGRYQRDTLLCLEAPTCVMKFNNGTDIWYDGFNCGYVGTGPNGSYKVLIDLGVPEDMANMVFQSRKLSFYKDGDGWQGVDRTDNIDDIGYAYMDCDVCFYNDKLVLVQNNSEKYKKETQYEDFIKKYSFFIPRPTEITFMSREDAISTGHYVTSFNCSGVYQIIIKDMSGSELWLDYQLDENKPINKQQNIESIMNEIGILIPENKESLSEKIKCWLGMSPIITDRVIYKR